MRAPSPPLVDENNRAVDPSLAPFLHPSGIVVVGASHNPTKLGFGLANNLVQSGFAGAIHFVNPRGGTLLGHPVQTSLADVPDPVDLAVLLIHASLVPQTLRDCGARGIRAVIVASGGFRETGADGQALEDECVRLAEKLGIRLVGPNCVGILDTHLPFDTTFLPPPGPTPGDIAFISHSGAICAVVIDWARGQGFGLSQMVSLGNQADVIEADLLVPVAADPNTRAVTLYLEGVREGRRFVAEAARASRLKPVLALKVGRFAGGRQAVASHTGALAGREAAYDAAFRRAGVLRAPTSEALFDWAKTLAWCPLPAGNNVAVLTNAGGPGVTAADAIEAEGLTLATLETATQSALRDLLPPAASVANPVDMLASATPEQYAEGLRLLLADPQVHSVLVIVPPPPMHSAGACARAMIPVIYAAEKPVVVALMGAHLIQEAVAFFRAARVPDFRFPERAAAALAALTLRADVLRQAPPVPVAFDDVDAGAVATLLDHVQPDRQGFLDQEVVLQIMRAYGLPVMKTERAASAEAAVQLAEQLGFPVALKVASPDIPHKSDVGGVLLHLPDGHAVAEGFATVVTHARKAQPDAEISGVYVQRMLPDGQDVIVGTVQDAQFGALAMFGSGGVEVEGLRDVAFALAPLPRREADDMLASTWAGRKLNGYRNLPPADREAVLDALLRIAQLAADFPQLAEIEINPLRVLPEGQGAAAVDVRIKIS